MVSRPPSTSRTTVHLVPAISTLEAKVACGHPSISASIWPTWLESSSIACLPMITRPGFSSPTIFAITRAIVRLSSAWSARTRIARSAPIANPVRNCSCQVCRPIEINTTSPPPCFSLIRSASSRAISSNGLITHLTLSVAIPEPSGRIRMVVAGSGTRFTGTRIFTAVSLRVYSVEHPKLMADGAVESQGPSRRGANKLTTAHGASQTGLILKVVTKLRQRTGTWARSRAAALLIVAQAMGQFAAGLQDQRRDLRIDALNPDAVGGPGDGERSDHRAGVIANRHGTR